MENQAEIGIGESQVLEPSDTIIRKSASKQLQIRFDPQVSYSENVSLDGNVERLQNDFGHLSLNTEEIGQAGGSTTSIEEFEDEGEHPKPNSMFDSLKDPSSTPPRRLSNRYRRFVPSRFRRRRVVPMPIVEPEDGYAAGTESLESEEDYPEPKSMFDRMKYRPPTPPRRLSSRSPRRGRTRSRSRSRSRSDSSQGYPVRSFARRPLKGILKNHPISSGFSITEI